MALKNYNPLTYLDENYSGGHYIALVHVDDVVSFPEIYEHVVLGEIELAPGVLFTTIDLLNYTLDLDIRKRISGSSDLHQHTISATVPKNRKQVLGSLQDFNNKNCIVLYVSYNGDQRLLGTPDNPVRFGWRSIYGENPADTNEYRLEIEWENAEEAPFYEEEIDLATCGPVTILLDGDLYAIVPPGGTIDIPLNDIFKEYFTIDNPSGMNKLVNDFQPIPIVRELRIDTVTDKSAEVELIEYSLNDVDYFDIEAALPLTIPASSTLYLRATIADNTTFAQFKLNGIYEPW